MDKYREVMCTGKVEMKLVTMVGMVQALLLEFVLHRPYHSFK